MGGASRYAAVGLEVLTLHVVLGGGAPDIFIFVGQAAHQLPLPQWLGIGVDNRDLVQDRTSLVLGQADVPGDARAPDAVDGRRALRADREVVDDVGPHHGEHGLDKVGVAILALVHCEMHGTHGRLLGAASFVHLYPLLLVAVLELHGWCRNERRCIVGLVKVLVQVDSSEVHVLVEHPHPLIRALPQQLRTILERKGDLRGVVLLGIEHGGHGGCLLRDGRLLGVLHVLPVPRLVPAEPGAPVPVVVHQEYFSTALVRLAEVVNVLRYQVHDVGFAVDCPEEQDAI
mmetsp:Transcript_50311/g.150301  ORF Transcript_50311/g.150301 Transcript_50311/m.150301 type:complete len:287 (+) Transcript_50311:104-964(+)